MNTMLDDSDEFWLNELSMWQHVYFEGRLKELKAEIEQLKQQEQTKCKSA